MTILKCIPTVGFCCFFISLVDGCYFTAFFSLFGILDYTFGILSTHISHCWDEDSSLQYFTGYFGYFMGFIGIVVAVIAAIFIWGVRKNKPFTAVWYMYAIATKALGLFIFGILLIAANTPSNESRCEYPIVKIISSFFLFALNLYFIIVVRSYYPHMEAAAESIVAEAAPPAQPIAVDTQPKESHKKTSDDVQG